MEKRILLLLLLASTAAAIPNPAAVYCTDLGYTYEKSNCVFPGGSSCDGWAFFRGTCGEEYSYCSLHGYSILTESADMGTYSTERAVCVSGTKRMEIQLPGLVFKSRAPSSVTGEECGIVPSSTSLPETFDWRNISNRSYINPVKDQAYCGSCYGFSATAVAEGAYNVALNLSDADRAEFSESFLIWCLASLPQYNYHFDGCYGSDYDYFELVALTTHGTILSEQFPYTIYDPGACLYWENPRARFSSRHRIPCSDIDAMKTAIMTYGPIDAAVAVTDEFHDYVEGIYNDSNTSCSGSPCYYTYSNHAISLVGWGNDPEYGDYWILRNSWGPSWGEGGYMRIAANAATVACSPTYLEFSPVDIDPVECYDGSGWTSCSSATTIESIRANCTSNSLGGIDSATFTLSNLTGTVFSGQGTMNSGYWTYDNDDLPIPEGSHWNLSVSCTESHGALETSSLNWTAAAAEETTTTTTTVPAETDPLCYSCSDCTSKLNGSHPSVTLTADIGNHSGDCIGFSSGNTEFDCAGHLIDGTGQGRGIQAFDLDNNTIRNCTVSDFVEGIYLAYSHNNTLEDNALDSNEHGIRLWYSHDNSVANNTANSNSLYGISLTYSHRNAVASNDLESNGWYGIILRESHNNTLSLNSMEYNTYEGLFLYGSFNNSIRENRACYNALLDFNIQSFPEYLEGWNETSSENLGDNNSCDSSYNWNDTSTVTGCRYSCEGTTTTIETCTLVGDEPPCGEIEQSEIIDLINLWAAGEAALSDVIKLILAWTS